MHPKLQYHLRKQTPVTAACLLWLMSRTVRIQFEGFGQVGLLGRVNFAHWHGDELALLPWFGKIHAAILVSHSQDGEMMARGAHWLGYHVVRGSSSKGGASGMVALIKATRKGYHGVLAVDGPRGPIYECKPGIVRLVQKSGTPLLPVGVAVDRRFAFKRSWNKTYLPLPFSRQIVYFDEPLYFDSGKEAVAMNRYCKSVETAMHTAHRKALEVLRRR
jgi:lysophospholipid acyltransferase (LPLAT)-like uncharacterized protein